MAEYRLDGPAREDSESGVNTCIVFVRGNYGRRNDRQYHLEPADLLFCRKPSWVTAMHARGKGNPQMDFGHEISKNA